MNSKLITVSIIDDSETDRMVLKAWLMENPKLHVDRMFSSVKEFMYHYKHYGILNDILVVDFYMPIMTGLELCDNISKNERQKILLVSNGFPGNIRTLLDSGIGGFVEKSKEKFIKAAFLIIEGGSYFDLDFLNNFSINNRSVKNDQEKPEVILKPCEIEIINLISCGLSYKEINKSIPKFSSRTIETYVQDIKRRVGANSNVQLVKWAMLMGYIYYFDDLEK